MTYRTGTLKRVSSSPFSQVANGVLRGSTRMMPSGVTRKILCHAPALARYRSPVICVMVRAGPPLPCGGRDAASCPRRRTNSTANKKDRAMGRMSIPFVRFTAISPRFLRICNRIRAKRRPYVMSNRRHARLWMAVMVSSVAALTFASLHSAAGESYAGKEWEAPGGDWAATRYSTLDQINTRNIKQLGGAWVVETPDRAEATPLLKDGRMFVVTAAGVIMALD